MGVYAVIWQDGKFQYQRLEMLLLQASKQYVTDNAAHSEKSTQKGKKAEKLPKQLSSRRSKTGERASAAAEPASSEVQLMVGGEISGCIQG